MKLRSGKRDSERGGVDVISKESPWGSGNQWVLKLCQCMCVYVYMMYMPVHMGMCECEHIHAMVCVDVRLWASVLLSTLCDAIKLRYSSLVAVK